ncbi:serine proteinase stubble-like isoform X2 [Daphnia carinata]|uniref:serine proteinase stubble-like isoform X2 n=1 Tax=Daphnia carinata TaxID=120202 RepID=UPI00257FC9C1|nr:serine proteinase stubble-like isoform X2 [Daphnia carinata]
MDFRFGMGLLLLSFLPLVFAASQTPNNLTTPSYQISRKPCYVKGQEGTCMFVWECVKTEGTPLGMCMERFMFGSCCAHDLDNDVFPKPSLSSMIATMASNYPPPIVPTNISSAATPSPPSILTTLITSVVPARINSTNKTETETTKPSSVQPLTIPTDTSTDATLSNELAPTTSLGSSTVTSTHGTTLLMDSKTSTTIAASSTQPPFVESTTKPSATKPTNPTLATAPPIAPSINLLIPNNIVNLVAVPVASSPTTAQSLITTIQLLTTLQHPDALVALTVPSSHLSPVTNQSNLSAPLVELPDSSVNELNATADIQITVPSATNKPVDKPYFHHVTTGVLSTTEAESTEPQSTQFDSSTIPSTVSPVTTSFVTKPNIDVTEFIAVSASSTETVEVTSTSTESSSRKPESNVTPTSHKNSTESTRKPTLAVTSLPSSYNIECGVPPMLAEVTREERIVGGNNSKFGSWPWQVSVRRTSFFGFSSTHRCGGALLNELWVITAGHCVEDLLVSQIRLRMGEFDFSTVQEPYPFVERGVNKKIVHPKYNFFTYEYDLALVRLEEPITFQPNIAPICLPATDESLIGQNGTVTGWGRLSEGGTLPSMLQQVTVPIVSNDKCKDMFLKAGRHEYIPDIFMCAGFEEGGRDSCQGDSGGPLQIRGRDGKYFLGGIISWGIGCAEANLPGVCTRISKFTNWILENVT